MRADKQEPREKQCKSASERSGSDKIRGQAGELSDMSKAGEASEMGKASETAKTSETAKRQGKQETRAS